MGKWGKMAPPSPQEQFVGIFSAQYSRDGLIGMLGGRDEGIAAFYRTDILMMIASPRSLLVYREFRVMQEIFGLTTAKG